MPEKILRTYLESINQKMTPERLLILQEIFATHAHFDPEDIFIRIKQKGGRVSRATVYRTIPLLLRCELVKEVFFGEKKTSYEHVWDHKHHDHLICLKCGKVQEYYEEEIEKLQEKVAERFHFKPVSHHHEIFGYCPDCR